MIKAKVSTDYKDIERIFAGGAVQKEIIKVWSTEADAYVFEAWRVLEMEGPLPLTFNSNGEPLIDYRIYGNTEQTGTPTPEDPIMPIGCGERTDNLWGVSIVNGAWRAADGMWLAGIPGYVSNTSKVSVDAETTYSFTFATAITSIDRLYAFFWGSDNTYLGYQDLLLLRVINIPSNAAFLTVSIGTTATSDISPSDISNIMLNAGSTALPYEPYGYKLPILSNSTVTNIYLGEVQTTRRIKKLVLTGAEGWKRDNETGVFNTLITNALRASFQSGICSHWPFETNRGVYILLTEGHGCIRTAYNSLWIRDNNFPNVADFKSFLAAQYAAGTPVTVWYVLAEPETGIVNEPLMKIGDYADTVDSTQTNVQIPTYKGTTIIDYDGGEKHFITSDGYALVDKNQNGFLLSGSTDSLCPEKMYIKYKGR